MATDTSGYLKEPGGWYDPLTGKHFGEDKVTVIGSSNPPPQQQQPAPSSGATPQPPMAISVGSAPPITGQVGSTPPNPILQNLLNYPEVQGTSLQTWLYGNESLLQGLISRGYTERDIINEAYSQVHSNKSAFAGDITTLPRSDNAPFGSPLPTPKGKEPETPVDPEQFTNRYGQAKEVSESVLQAAMFLIGNAFTGALNKGAITQDTFNRLLDPANIGRYANALLYGGYTLGDVFQDLKAKELGIPSTGMDGKTTADKWYNTTEGKALKDNGTLTPPIALLGWDKSVLENTLFQLPSDAFSSLVPTPDWNSPEWIAERDKIKATYYDIMVSQAEADTSQKQQIADETYNQFIRDTEKNFGIKLSTDARQAWGELQKTFSGQGKVEPGMGGLASEQVDKYLTEIRRTDQQGREATLTAEEQQQRKQLLDNGSEADIQAFVSQNPAKAKLWGLVPDDTIKSQFSVEGIMAQDPKMTREQAKAYHDLVLDQYGNFRSTLYKTLYSNKYSTIYGEGGKIAAQEAEMQRRRKAAQDLLDSQFAINPFTQAAPESTGVVKIPGMPSVTQPPTGTVTAPLGAGITPKAPLPTTTPGIATSIGSAATQAPTYQTAEYDQYGNLKKKL